MRMPLALPNSISSLMGRKSCSRKKRHTWHQTVQANLKCIWRNPPKVPFSKRQNLRVSHEAFSRVLPYASILNYPFFPSTGRRRRSFGLRERWAMVSSRHRQLRHRLWTSKRPGSLHKSRRLRGMDRTDHFDSQTEVKPQKATFHFLESQDLRR